MRLGGAPFKIGTGTATGLSSDQLEAALRITGVDRMVFVGDIGFGNGMVGGVLTDTYPSGNGGPYDIIGGGPPVYFHA